MADNALYRDGAKAAPSGNRSLTSQERLAIFFVEVHLGRRSVEAQWESRLQPVARTVLILALLRRHLAW